MADVVVEMLSKAHDQEGFDCGATDQNEFLWRKAGRHSKIGYSQTYVAVEPGKPRIYGFVTLSMGSIEFAEIDEAIRARLPKYPMPVLRLGQLGTDLKFQGKGIAPFLIRFASEKAIEMASKVGCYALVIDADKQKAFDWYVRQGFLPLKKGGMSVFQTIEMLIKAIRRADSP